MYSIKLTLSKSNPVASAASAMLSPCIGVCELNAANICTGCHRTSSEIGAWSSMTDAERGQIMARLDQLEAD